ncbi:hypothetical protein [Flagellimonas sp. CMM7]|uniref:hypothetical protein n=1 Tax=Flagellimonas sp. CMM7 TaxID=2654676 RepID=UPI0013D3B6B9|nr:hypothetical protein [Flagellimonas sp. CMM7]UII78597.1 hypothetical protein LV704_13085 [Flagellimonas sp. CMM7]
MKLKFLILISSLLFAPLTSGEVISTQPLECITSEVEEEIYVDVIAPIVDDVIIEDGGSFGNEALVQEPTEVTHIDIPVRLSIGCFSNVVNTRETPRYITYCCLKIAC